MTGKEDAMGEMTRRRFIGAGALGAAGLLAGCAAPGGFPTIRKLTRPNFLVVLTDQQNLDALSAHGNPHVHTPNLDRLVRRGVSFMESHSANPVCSPARSALFTGRMASETGVPTNTRPIHESIPNLGQWLRRSGYDTAYAGKWHLPLDNPEKTGGFDLIPSAGMGQGDLADPVVSRSCESFLLNRKSKTPFLLVASFVQPHDICYWAIKNRAIVPEKLRFDRIADQLPDLPPNHKSTPRAPEHLYSGYGGFNEMQWRYYLYVYCRQVEMADADIGRVLDALEDSGHADNTIVIFTADHGEGAGRHMNVQKWYPYDEACKVPMIVSCPGNLLEDVQDRRHLVSGLDLVPTVCDYAQVGPPPDCRGRSLRPLLEGGSTEWREFVAVETQVCGRVIRTPRYKYVKYKGDPVEQLFDMEKDPWETENLYDRISLSDEVKTHRKLLAEWEASLKPIPPTHCDYPNPPWLQTLLDIQYGRSS
jgi:arylsulfatase A-like enzyme